MRAAEFFNQWQPHLSVGLEFFRFEGSDLIAEVAGYHSQSPHDGPIGRLPSHHTVSSQTRTFLGRGQQPCRRPLRVKSDGLTVGLSLPLWPQLRTFSATVGMSQTVESRMGAVAWAIRQRSVSHPRSSNRTCPIKASGSPTGFT